MPVIAVIGAQWGDEGKGRVTDMLAEKANLVVRFSGGDNAGHTVINPYGEFALQLVPCGIFNREAVCIIGNGVVINPAVLIDEMERLNQRGVDTSKLFISDRANLIMPYHILLDGLEEESRGGKAIGTTRKGIGPAFADKIARSGIRAGDLLDKGAFLERLRLVLDNQNKILTNVYGAEPLSLDEVFQQYCQYGERLAPHIKETTVMLEEALNREEMVLLEGAQGTLLDPDFGTYPFGTSSPSIAGAGSLGSGIGPTKISRVIGVYKAFCSRVGEGPMPTELGFTGMAITRLDILDALPKLKICVGYKLNGETINHFPGSAVALEKCEPVYEEMEGWQTSTSDVREYAELPVQARQYIERLEELIACPANIICIGAKREQAILKEPIL